VQPNIHAFPVNDTEFRTFVLDVLKTLGSDEQGGNFDVDEVEGRVNERYRNVQIVVRDQSSSYDLVPVWYAYRDGRVRTDDARRERLYESLSKAREVVGQASDAMEHSRATARRAGYR
jgi:hypothetical protein